MILWTILHVCNFWSYIGHFIKIINISIQDRTPLLIINIDFMKLKLLILSLIIMHYECSGLYKSKQLRLNELTTMECLCESINKS